MNTKTCTKCGTIKPLNDYHNNKRTKDGKQSQCKECKRAQNRAWHEANRERSRANGRAWKEANLEHHRARSRAWAEANKERKRVNSRAWYEKNKERLIAKAISWNEANKERSRATARTYRELNPEKNKTKLHRRRARKAHAVPQRWKRTTCPDHLCYWCGTTLTPEITHIDHIMPISLGGQDTPDNTANTCAKCNLTKSNAHPLVWLARITTPDPIC